MSVPGRPRDDSIDARVLDVTRQHLAAHGWEGLSLAAVAQEAGTSRQALYRRWPGKAELVTSAIAGLPEAAPVPASGDPFADLVAELEAFRKGVTRPDGLSLVGTMLQRGTDPELVRLYRQKVVEPRRTRLKRILERGQAEGLLDPEGDLKLAVASLTGSFYALSLAGKKIGKDWPERAAAHAWRALGGTRLT